MTAKAAIQKSVTIILDALFSSKQINARAADRLETHLIHSEILNLNAKSLIEFCAADMINRIDPNNFEIALSPERGVLILTHDPVWDFNFSIGASVLAYAIDDPSHTLPPKAFQIKLNGVLSNEHGVGWLNAKYIKP